MRDITHPYLGLGSLPLKPETASAVSARETPELERIRAEILRLGAVSGPDPDWRVVIECAVVILRDQRKDLQVGAYLCWGLFEREGYTGLAVGLTIIKDMVALYWDSLHPPGDRIRARLASLDWLAENLSARIERRLPAPGDGAALERALAVFVDLEESLRRLFGGQAPPFGHARRQVAEYLGQLPGPKPQPFAPLPSERPTLPAADVPPAAAAPVSPPLPPFPEQPTIAAPMPRPSPPWDTKRILTPAERAHRRTRILVAAVLGVAVAVTAAGGSAYWYYEIKRVEDVALNLLSAVPEERAAGLLALTELPERQRKTLLRSHQDRVLDVYVFLAQQAADRYALVEAEDFLETALAFYPDSARLRDARIALKRREADIRADVAARKSALRASIAGHLSRTVSAEDRPVVQAMLDRMLQLIAQADLRNARETLNKLAARLPANDPILARQIPDLAAFAVVELAEGEMGQDRFTRSLQLISDGVVFLPDHPLLNATGLRHRTNRSEYILRRTVDDLATLDSLLVRQAAEQMRAEAPKRFGMVEREITYLLAKRISETAKTNFEQSRTLSQAARGIFPNSSAF